MITKKEYFSHPDFNYEEIKERLESVIDEGINMYGEAVISLDSEYEAGKVLVDKECDCCKGLNIGHATINLRYLNELVYRVHKAGLDYQVCSDTTRHQSPTKIIIYVKC